VRCVGVGEGETAGEAELVEEAEMIEVEEVELEEDGDGRS